MNKKRSSWMDWNLSSKVFFFKVNNKKTNQKYHSTMKRALQAIITFSFEWNLYTYTIAFRIMSCKLRELFIHSTLFHGFYKERNHLIGNSWKKKKKKTKKISLFTRFFFNVMLCRHALCETANKTSKKKTLQV